jgi:uncharacterized radical SAM superfamily Fe-S cluster-containing enzyme
MRKSLSIIAPRESIIKHTTSRCTVCLSKAPAKVVRDGGKILMVRTCPEHGEQSYVISGDERFYWLSHGSQSCCAPGQTCNAAESATGVLGRNAQLPAATPFESLSTCLALIEIVDSCNLACPTCYANSPVGTGSKVAAHPLESIKERILGVINRKGGIEILQLSGGEPTLHPQFFELIDWIKSEPRIQYLLINTNGVLLAKNSTFAAELAKRVSYDNLQLYLQFDGTNEPGQRELRGADLRSMKETAIHRAREMKLPVTLAMTVTPDNISDLWTSIAYGLSFPHVRGITFQPVFVSGRQPVGAQKDESPYSVADIIINAVEQSDGKLTYDDFTPLPCGDPNCATIGYLLKLEDGIKSISDLINLKSLQGFLADRVRYSLEDLSQCGCESEPLGALLKQCELDESHTFRIFIKPFMDARSWDEDRIDRCCTHVIRPDGKLDSFCRYYSGFPDSRA